MNIENFINTVKMLPPEIAVLLRAGTGVGKSHIVADLAENHYNLPFIDVRGSTMSEGDAGGYPDIEGMKENGVMTFCMPSWFVRACTEPVVLFLDELNRSLPAVQQSFFQLVLDRQLGNDKNGMPYNVHPGTRIFSAVNHGSEYDVNDIDPALLRRFWVCDLDSTKEDWISWATENNIDSLVIDFIDKNPHHLRVDPSSVEPGTVIPTNASWHRLDSTFKHQNISLINLVGNKDSTRMLYNVATGFIGKEAAIDFSDFIEKYEVILTPENILNEFDEYKDRIKELSNDRINTLINHLGENAKINEWTVDQSMNAAEFGKSISEEMLLYMWSIIAQTKNLKTIQNFHKFIGKSIVDAVTNSKDLLDS